MFKLLTLLVLTIAIFMQTAPAYCGVSRTMVFQLSVTIPEHVILNSGIAAAPFSNNPYQLIQTQMVVRNNRTISLTSIVVP